MAAKGTKTGDSKNPVRSFLPKVTKKQSKNVRIDNGTKLAGEFKTFCRAAGKQIYITMNWTKAPTAERTKRCFKKIFYRSVYYYGCMYVHKWPQFVKTLYCRKTFLDTLDTKEGQQFRLFVTFVQVAKTKTSKT